MLVQIILFDGFDLLDAIGPYEVLTAAGMQSGGGIQVDFVSAAGARMVPSGPGGLPIPAGGQPDLDRASIILIPGAAGPTQGDGPDTVPAMLAREAEGELPRIAAAGLSRPGITVATVCGGSLILAMAGLLQGRPAVTHHLGMALLETAGGVPIKARVVDDGNLVTGGGVTSGIDVALHLVERFHGPRIAHAVETLFEYERRGTVWRNCGSTPAGVGQTASDQIIPDSGVVAPGPGEPGVAGRWDVTIATPMGKQAVTYDISVANGAVAGTATQGTEVTPLIGLAAFGNRLTWSQHVTKPMKLTLRFDVVVTGDSMTGTAKAGVLPSSRLIGARRHAALAPA
ncbi:DJ-1/PfpI family protein [Lichenicoccus sp.]|uniref:DJ-1/PfpI family protein n=1 Tax=Lichenicoccus sp. TaxID=2781899 RepID=UPI003D0C4690